MIGPTVFDVMQIFERAKIHYRIDTFNSDVITLFASVPGQRWEIEFFEDRSPEIEIFRSDGQVDVVNSSALAHRASQWQD